jgi:hypothetical protein
VEKFSDHLGQRADNIYPMIKSIAWLTVALPVAMAGLEQAARPQPSVLLEQLGLNAEHRAAIDQGRPVAKVLQWGTASEVYVLGAVYINGSPAVYLKAARNISALAKSPGYLGTGELPATATSADLGRLTLDPDDIKALKSCREGSCDVQLPTASIQAFHQAVNWSQPDADSQVNGLARGMILDLVREYRRGGNDALGVYRDKDNPTRVANQFALMVGRSATLPDVLPELRKYLLQYPAADLAGADSYFYWEKVNFGLKPTIRVNHGVIYRSGEEGADVSVVAIKQLYASHYFHTALDVSVCMRDPETPGRRGFYLLTLKSSEQDGLTGMSGSMLRKVAVDKTRSGLEKALASIKQTVERTPTAAQH